MLFLVLANHLHFSTRVTKYTSLPAADVSWCAFAGPYNLTFLGLQTDNVKGAIFSWPTASCRSTVMHLLGCHVTRCITMCCHALRCTALYHLRLSATSRCSWSHFRISGGIAARDNFTDKDRTDFLCVHASSAAMIALPASHAVYVSCTAEAMSSDTPTAGQLLG
jgi:hypothetical protein